MTYRLCERVTVLFFVSLQKFLFIGGGGKKTLLPETEEIKTDSNCELPSATCILWSLKKLGTSLHTFQ